MSTGPIAENLARTTHILPALKSLYPKLPELNEYPYDIVAQELTRWGEPRPPSPHFAQYDKIVSDALRDIGFDSDPKSRLDQGFVWCATSLPARGADRNSLEFT